VETGKTIARHTKSIARSPSSLAPTTSAAPSLLSTNLGYCPNFDIGYYVVAANVSDIAAMGATPLGALTVVRYPNDLDDESFEQIMVGIHQAAADFGTLNVGGDIGQAERIILSATAFGLCEQDRVLSRSGSRPGDLLCVNLGWQRCDYRAKGTGLWLRGQGSAGQLRSTQTVRPAGRP
jgi:hypothetical protein